MTEEELREKIAKILMRRVSVFKVTNQAFNNTYLYDIVAKEIATEILALVREAGYKSPEEFVRCPVCGEEYSANQLMECVEEIEEQPMD